MYTEKDIKQFESKSITVQTIDEQIANFKKGFPWANLVKPAVIGDGILALTPAEIDKLVNRFDENKRYKLVKFVPASGAASRMFKALYEYVAHAATLDEAELIEKDKSFNSPWTFIQRIRDFAFYEDLKSVLKKNGHDIDALIAEKKYAVVIDFLLNEKGLGYGTLPKGLLKFHSYNDTHRTSLEEHLAEGAAYCRSENNIVYIHFTVSPEHVEKFEERVQQVAAGFEERLGVTYHITFSVQKPSTDTIAVDMADKPFRETDGSILFRPGGHGALIENLNDIDANVVFIKNIDNVVPDRLKPETVRYKKTIGGLLLRLQENIHTYLNMMDHRNLDEQTLNEITTFARQEANIRFPEGFDGFDPKKKQELLFDNLNRPIRICGMVKNEGEPGGGPFWVRNTKGEVSLQIVESSQINMEDAEQKAILDQATHFNPVDLVCGLKNYEGEHFELGKFVDPETGFISTKSKGGKNLKAQELPGLWNGAMADWITLFVEVPVIT
ncbi:MAG: DUF4301 family protein, partial [Bacteroidales bacterium]|nr:DUF4301 family protein [Bacteroidales bacterium]